MVGIMATRRVEQGPTGSNVRQNVARYRKRNGKTMREIAELMAEAGRPLPHTAISDIENGSRRVDVDDLTALAAALGVSPLALLMPQSSSRDDQVTTTGYDGLAVHIYQWLRGDALPDALDDPAKQFRFALDSRPPWAITATMPAPTIEVDGIPVAGPEKDRGNGDD